MWWRPGQRQLTAATSESMSIAVLVPTYRRPEDLFRCLGALARQTCPAEQIIVVHRQDDLESAAILSEVASLNLPLDIVHVSSGGQVAALNAGLSTVRCDIVAITDDDAAPHPFWLNTIREHYLLSPKVGGVGGKDYIHRDSSAQAKHRVGILTWYGRPIGNHHIGIGAARRVQFLKGANMSYRMEAVADLQFDERLLGAGAQVHNDLAFALSVAKRGWQLIYDPSIVVNHFPASRFDADQRSGRSAEALLHSAHNETVAVLSFLPRRFHLFFWMSTFLVGSRALPGLAQCVRFTIFDRTVWLRFITVQRGRRKASRTLRLERK